MSIKEYLTNAGLTYSLKKKYYWLTSCVGLTGVVLGLLLFSTIFRVLAVENTGILVLLLLVLFLVCIFAGIILVASVTGFCMYKFGALTKEEAKNYALYSRYPSHWFPKNQ